MPMVGFLAGPEYPSRLAAGFPWLDGTAAVHAFREMPGRQGVTGSCLRSVCKPHFVQPGSQVYTRGRHPCSLAWAIISLCSLPETQAERAAPRLCLTLLPTGVAWPSALLRTPVVSCTAFSPSPRWDRKAPGAAVVFCGPIRQISPSRDFPGVVPCRVRTFLDFRRTEAATARPA